MDREKLKKAAGEAAAALVEDSMVVGLGTGSTVRHTVLELGRRVREEGLRLLGVPTSVATEHLARREGIPLTDLDAHPRLDLTIDGADEFDDRLRLIKGGGGALTREKIVWNASRRAVAVVDAGKRAQALGSTFAVPIEVIGLGKTPVLEHVRLLGAEARLRTDAGGLYLTDNGNPIVDAKWPAIEDPDGLELHLETFPGVVCCGLFLGMCDAAYVASEDGVETVRPAPVTPGAP